MALPEGILDFAKWAWVAIAAPAFGWIAGHFAARRQLKRRKKVIIRELAGLPNECKLILFRFYEQQTHTRREDPASPPMNILVNRGIMYEGTSGGTFDAIVRFMSIRPDVWEVMDEWVDYEKSRTVADAP